MSLDDADQLVRTSIANRLHLMSEDGKELHKILRDSSEALKATKGKLEKELTRAKQAGGLTELPPSCNSKYGLLTGIVLLPHRDGPVACTRKLCQCCCQRGIHCCCRRLRLPAYQVPGSE